MKFQSGAAVLLAAALPSALAQTWTACDPTKKDCPCDPALGTTYSFDFTKGKGSDIFPAEKYFPVTYESDGAHLPVKKKGDAPTLAATKFIMGGKLEAVLKIAPGKGIVSSLVFQSDDLDEIDYEWIGSKGYELQTNYFGKGNTEQYNRGGIHPVEASEAKFHKYTIDWTKEAINWYLDDKLVRTLTPAQSAEHYGSPNYYPQTPMQIKIGSWAAGDPDNAEGTIQWADGPIDYSKGPFEMVIQSISLTDYSVGATEYCYGDKSGSWDSIQIKKGGKSSNPPSSSADDDKKTTSAAATPKPTTADYKPSSTTSSSSSLSSYQTTLATSTSTSISSSNAPQTTKATTVSSMNRVQAITQGIPDSIGGYTPAPEYKAVSTSTTSASAAAATSASPTITAPPVATNGASSTKSLGLGGLVCAAVAAVFVL